MTQYLPVTVHVEFMDGRKRAYWPVGGFVNSPEFSGEGEIAVALLLTHVGGPSVPVDHVASIPLMQIRQWRIDPAEPERKRWWKR